MKVLSEIHLSILIFVVVGSTYGAKTDQCTDTRLMLSGCDESNQKEWVVEVPSTEHACDGKSIAQPRPIPCNFQCPAGQAADSDYAKCEMCSPGTYSLGGGKQYTFDQTQGINSSLDWSVRASGLLTTHSSTCVREKLWRIKGNILQGEVLQNCAIEFVIRFKLRRAGQIRITYNLPTSLVFASIKSRCSFDVNIGDDNEDDNDEAGTGLKRLVEFKLDPTGYGVWFDKTVEVREPGDYVLSLYTIGLNSFHFPFSIRSITIAGTSTIQRCDLCPTGTFAPEEGSASCTPCPQNTYASTRGSTKCRSCDTETEYSDEGSTKCLTRPECQAKDYQKVFIGCDTSNFATFRYQPIEPKICTGEFKFDEPTKIPCGTCNPGMFKNQSTRLCQFCPSNTYSNGSLAQCLPCSNDLSLTPGLYFKLWNEFPPYLNRRFISFDDSQLDSRSPDNQSWIPSIDYISAQAFPDTLSDLSLTITEGFRRTALAKMNRVYGTLYFKFSVQCRGSCILTLISQDIFDKDFDEWNIIHKWRFNETSTHKTLIEYRYSITNSDPVMLDWLFATETDVGDVRDEIRIYEIRVTDTVTGGSDRCVSCLTNNNQETECKSCSPGHILANNTCIRCPPSTIATRQRSSDLVPNVCKPCQSNTISDDGVTCIVPCAQQFNGNIPYDLQSISSMTFHGSKLFTQKGSGYFHVFNASICGKGNVVCAKTPTSSDQKHPSNDLTIESKLCRMGVVPDKNETVAAVAYIDDFGEQLVNVSLIGSKYFPALRSDYNLTDITFVYRANTSNSQSSCLEHVTYLSFRCDHNIDDEEQTNSTKKKYVLQSPTRCATGTCDGCTFHFLLRTPLACPVCDGESNGFRSFYGPCKLGRQEVRKIPFPYCSHNLTEKVEIHRCSIFSTEIQIIIILFFIIAVILVALILFCWRKNRKLEYRYMQLVENNNPDDDAPVDNVCAQISDEEDSGEEIQFKQSRTKKLINAVRNVIQKNSNNGQADPFARDSFLLTSSTTNDA